MPFDARRASRPRSRDEARGRRHFPSYRVRAEQIELARAFARTSRSERGAAGRGRHRRREVARLPRGGDPVRDPRAPRQASAADRDLDAHQAAPGPARREGHRRRGALPRLPGAARALDQGPRELRLRSAASSVVLAEGARAAACSPRTASPTRCSRPARARARTARSARVPAALLRRYPAAARPAAPLGRRARRAVHARAVREAAPTARSAAAARRCAKAHLVVANHDLLLRWPPDYPAFEHAIVDEAHELPDVADEVYALEVRPDEVLERIDELFGRPRGTGPRARRGAARRRRAPRRSSADARAWRRELRGDSRGARPRARAARATSTATCRSRSRGARLRRGRERRRAAAAARIEEVADDACPTRSRRARARARARRPARARREALRARLPRDAGPDAVAAFEDVDARPSTAGGSSVRPVSPGADFAASCFARARAPSPAVSASLFVGGDAFAALGDLELRGARRRARRSASRCRARSTTATTCAWWRCAAAATSCARRPTCSSALARRARRPHARSLHQPAAHGRGRRRARRRACAATASR